MTLALIGIWVGCALTSIWIVRSLGKYDVTLGDLVAAFIFGPLAYLILFIKLFRKYKKITIWKASSTEKKR